MSVKNKIRSVMERLTGIYFLRTMPRGVRLEHDLRLHLPRLAIRTIFDVGANVGQSAEYYLDKFPGAEIHCFEPAETTFRQLELRLKGRAILHRIGFGAVPSVGHLSIGGCSEMRSLSHADDSDSEEIQLQCLDDFSRDGGIESIDLLKIDTEGYDLEVLKGAEKLLRRQQITVIQVEAGMYPQNKRHVSFEVLKSHLEERDYLLFAVYDQIGEWILGAPNLRRTNPVFISRQAIYPSTS